MTIIDDDEYMYVERWPKLCLCGKKISEEEWDKLDYAGVQRSEFYEDLPDFELRKCSNCKSTLTIACPDDFVIDYTED